MRVPSVRCLCASLLMSQAAVSVVGFSQEKQRPGVYQPLASAPAQVREGSVRFTILTPRLIRMEWATDGATEDRASFAFVNRELPVPPFKVSRSDGNVTIQTDVLRLVYSGHGAKFSASNLNIRFLLNGKDISWQPGQNASGNLLGTARTLDHERGMELDFPMQQGLVSRDGWSVVDDSLTPVFTSANFSFVQGQKSPWPWFVRRSAADRQDWYFFGYGHDYRSALVDFRSISGPVPLPPRWSFGSMWTRYWPYTDRDLLDLIRQFHEENVPLDAR